MTTTPDGPTMTTSAPDGDPELPGLILMTLLIAVAGVLVWLLT